jgi:HSP20 family protein
MFDLTPFRRRRDLSPAEYGRDFIRDFFDFDPWLTTGFRADIKENAVEYIVEAELPGFNKEQMVVELSDHTLTISAQQNEEINEERPNYVRKERRQGNFSRSFYVENVNNEKVNAEYKDGLLIVTLPKLKEENPNSHRIDIR